MKYRLLFASVITSVISSNAFAFDVRFADESWNGNNIPKGQQCQKFGGKNPSTPKLIVDDIPPGSDAILLEYSDRDYKKMDNGGHGRISYTLNTSLSKVEIPPIPGHTFDIPVAFKMIEAHRSPGWDKAGAYMPPCSGRKGHAYYVTVKAVKGDKVTATSVLEMGKF